MRIGVDATCWHNTRGYGRYVRSLLRRLIELDASSHYTFFVDSTERLDGLPPRADVRLVPSSAPTAVAASSSGRRSLRDMWRMSRALSQPGFDLLLFPTVYSYVPVATRARKIVIIHDVIAEKLPQLTLPTRSARLFWQAKVALGRWQADAIVTVSEYSKRAVVEHFKIPADDIFVVGEASDPIFRRLDQPGPTPRLEALGLEAGGRSVVYVGGFGPHKNLAALLEAFGRLATRPELSDVRLVMVGEHQSEVFFSAFDALRRQVDALGLQDRVIFTGYLPDEDVVALLNLATVLALPSLMEGFGLPAVEAAACGCPVIATTESPLPDLLGEGGLYVDPGRPEELERALARVLGSEALRGQMRAAGLAAARRLTWDAAAEQMLCLTKRVGAR